MIDVARRTITIADGAALVSIRPDLGAGLSAYDFLRNGQREPLFRRAPDDASDPFALSNILLAPWSNRVSGGGFPFAGRFHSLSPNISGEPLPIHGSAFNADWTMEHRRDHSASLTRHNLGPAPFRFRAWVDYALKDGALTMTLSVVNDASEPLPYGLGFHPWLPRTPGTLLTAPAQRVWLEDERHLPAGLAPISDRPQWDFTAARRLPVGWINNFFAGWTGRAQVRWEDRGLALDVEADEALSTYMLYSPSEASDFFCFEPVSHPVDAHNLPGGPEHHGLIILQPGERMSATCKLTPFEI
jgi:aldose 1-epimerase